MQIFGFLASLLPLLLIGAIVAGIVTLTRSARESEQFPGIGTTRRLFLYGLSFIALMLAASGLTLLLSSILDSLFVDAISRGGSGRPAFGLAATIVGFPIWALLWRAGQKSLERYPGEAGSLGRKFYIYTVLFITAAVTAITLSLTLRHLIGLDDEFKASSMGAPIVFAAIWAFHWRMEANEGQPSLLAKDIRELATYLAAAYGLVMLAFGTAFLLQGLLADAYSSVFTDRLVGLGGRDLWGDNARTSFAVALVGGLWWAAHWHRFAARDRTSGARVASVYVLGIFGGLVASVAGISMAVFAILKWILDTDRANPANHFDALPAAAAVTIIGVAVWLYFAAIAQQDAEDSAEHAASGRRVYRYLSSMVGLATLGVGLAVIVGVAIGLITQPTLGIITSSAWWITPLAAALTSILVGAPLWVRQWLQRQRAADAADPAERMMQSRRAYLFIVFGLAVLATLISASIVLFNILEAVLEGDVRREVFNSVKYGVGVVISAALISAYHWQILKEDRAAEEALPPEQRAQPVVVKRLIAVASSEGRAVVAAIVAAANARTTYWDRRDNAGAPTLDEAQVSEIVAQVSNSPGDEVLIIVDESGVQVIPI